MVGYSGVLDEEWWIFNAGLVMEILFIFLSHLFCTEPGDKTDDQPETQASSGEPSHSARDSLSRSPTRSASPGPALVPTTPTTPATSTPTTPTTSVARPSDPLSPTVYQNPNWLRELKASFKEEVIDVCSVKAIEAAEANKYIEVKVEN